MKLIYTFLYVFKTQAKATKKKTMIDSLLIKLFLVIIIQLSLLSNASLIAKEVKQNCSLESTTLTGTLYRQSHSGRLEVSAQQFGVNVNKSASSVSKCDISDLRRLQVFIRDQPVAGDQLMSMAKLLEKATATKSLLIEGPTRVLKRLVSLQLMPNISFLSVACTDRDIDSLYPIGADTSRASRLATIDLYSCLWTNDRKYSSPALLSNLPELVSAKLDRVKLINLRVGHFTGLPVLRYLYLTRCDLISFDSGSLDELQALQHLTISDNPELKQFPRKIFQSLTNLEKLSLTNNGLQDVSSVFKGGQLQRLSQLDLSGNDIRSLAMDAFEGLENLRALLLGGNRLLKLARSADLSSTPSLALCSLRSLKLFKFDAIELKNKTDNVICNRLALNSRYDVTLMLMSARFPSTCSAGSGAGWCRRRLEVVKEQHPMELPIDDKLLPQQQQHQQQQQQQNSPNMALLLIFGAICVIHLIVTGTLACVCWRMVVRRRTEQSRPTRRRRQGQLTVAAGGASKKVNGARDSDCYEAVDGCSGGALMAAGRSETDAAVAAPVLISFRARPGDEQTMGDDFVIENEFPTREKTCYQFNEDA